MEDDGSPLNNFGKGLKKLFGKSRRGSGEDLTEQEISCRLEQDSILFKDMPDDRLSTLMAGVAASGAGLLRIEEQQQNLEDIFLELTDSEKNTGEKAGEAVGRKKLRLGRKKEEAAEAEESEEAQEGTDNDSDL